MKKYNAQSLSLEMNQWLMCECTSIAFLATISVTRWLLFPFISLALCHSPAIFTLVTFTHYQAHQISVKWFRFFLISYAFAISTSGEKKCWRPIYFGYTKWERDGKRANVFTFRLLFDFISHTAICSSWNGWSSQIRSDEYAQMLLWCVCVPTQREPLIMRGIR